jgi:hypothetical protein
MKYVVSLKKSMINVWESDILAKITNLVMGDLPNSYP